MKKFAKNFPLNFVFGWKRMGGLCQKTLPAGKHKTFRDLKSIKFPPHSPFRTPFSGDLGLRGNNFSKQLFGWLE